MPTLALVSTTVERYAEIVIDPLFGGFHDAGAGADYKLSPAEEPVARAVLTHMWEEARSQWDPSAAASRPLQGGPVSSRPSAWRC